jgi:RNA polymerase sigma factor (sigma-70 family)
MSNRSLLLAWRQRWNDSLFQFLRRRVRSAVDVQDLVQETYLRLLRAQDLGEVRDPHSYLFKVASHVALEWCERQARRGSVVEVSDDMLVDDELPELVLDARISQERFEKTLAAVPAMMRAVLVMRLRDELPLEEIATQLQITVRQVRRYLARGYGRLREAMES